MFTPMPAPAVPRSAPVDSLPEMMTNDEILRLTALSPAELERSARIPFRIVPDFDALMEDFARAILDEIRAGNARGEPVRLILPIGPVAQYRRVVEASNREGLSWKNVHTFNMDEFLDWEGRPISSNHPLSFEGYMRREVFGRLDPRIRIPEAQTFFPHPFRIDEISERIRAVGGIDCCFGGIGYHGHVAFNEPPLSRWNRISIAELRRSRTRVVVLGDDSIVVQSIHSSGGCSAAIPPMAVTLGFNDILCFAQDPPLLRGRPAAPGGLSHQRGGPRDDRLPEHACPGLSRCPGGDGRRDCRADLDWDPMISLAPSDRRTGLGLRWWILLMLFLAITINMLDRQVLSLVAPVLRDQFHLTNTDYGRILFCFLLGMTMGQIPVGQALDRYGVRWGFPAIVVLWSIANMLHGFARTVGQFGFLRWALGLNECGTYSGGVKVIGQWFPVTERAFACGLFNSGSLAGAILAPPLIVWIILRFGWPAAFLVPGLIGIIWVVPWLRIYWEPARHPRLRPADRETIATWEARPNIPGVRPKMLKLLRRGPVWGVILMRAFGGPVTHFYWYWLPEYLKRDRGMSLEMIGVFASLPFLFGSLGNIGGGWLSGWLILRGWTVNRARKGVVAGAVALSLAAVLVPLVRSPQMAVGLICVASLGVNAVAANHIGIVTDLFPPNVLARVTGMTGVGDGTVSMILMLVTGIVVDRYSFLPIFIAAGLLPLLQLLSLLFLVGRIQPLALEETTGTGPVPACA